MMIIFKYENILKIATVSNSSTCSFINQRFPRLAGGGDCGLDLILCSGGGEYLWGALCLARRDLDDGGGWGGDGGL